MTYIQKSGNKYHAKSSIYNGSYYMSQLEAAYAAELDLRVRAKDIVSWEKQIRVSFVIHGIKICDYIVDFKILHNDGSIEWVETKGFVTDVARIKMRMFEAVYLPEHPNERYTVVKKQGAWFPRRKLSTK
jgi:hypothetical protein